MIPQVYKFVIVNNTGQDLAFTEGGRLVISISGWFVDPSTGKTTYEVIDNAVVAGAFDTNGEVVIDGGEVIFPQFVNTSRKHLGILVSFECIHDKGALADGALDLYISAAQETGKLPTDGSNYGGAEASKLQQVGSLTYVPNSDDQNVFSDVFNL